MAMYEGNWKCSNCGGAITELPFQPRSESGLTCRACFAKQKEAEKSVAPVPEMQTASEPMPDEGIPDFDESHIAGEAPPDDGLAGLEATAPANTEKKTFAGNWQCAQCGGSITSLPFEPRNTSNLKCLDCFKANRG